MVMAAIVWILILISKNIFQRFVKKYFCADIADIFVLSIGNYFYFIDFVFYALFTQKLKKAKDK